MLYLTGFLLSYIKYGDNDCVLHCFTKEKGFQSFFVRGIYSKNSRQKAYLQPLAEVCFTIQQKRTTGSMMPVSKIDLVVSPGFAQNMKANAVVFFVADFLNQVLRHEHQNPAVYGEILFFLQELGAENYQSHLIFLLKFLEISGVHPLVNTQKFLDPETGNFVNSQVHVLFTEELSGLWKSILTGDNPYDSRITPELRKPLMDSILVYYHYHFTEFKVPNSLEIVQQLF